MKPSKPLFALAICNAIPAIATPPNLVVVMVDEHNFRTMGCYRAAIPVSDEDLWGAGNIVETPNIDALAASGALCTSFYTPQPVSTPSRSTFFTGLYTSRTGMIDNNIPLPDSTVTFAHALCNEGYNTAYFGKWHLDGDSKPGWAPERKFGFTNNTYMFNRGHWKKLAEDENGPRVDAFNDKGQPFEGTLAGADEKSFTTDFLMDRAIRYIEANADQPFCCVIAIPDPHGPELVREPYTEPYRNMVFKEPLSASINDPSLPSWATIAKTTMVDRGQMPAYYGMVRCIDDNMGKLDEALRRAGIHDNTIVVFTADHGELMGEHHLDNKGKPFETSAKIPFILRYPGKVKPGSVVPHIASLVDFAPTILSLMNIATNEKYDGSDRSSYFTGEKKELPKVIFSRMNSWIAAIDARYKLIYAANDVDRPVLYDVTKDSQELYNVYASNPAEVKRLANALLDYMAVSGDAMSQNAQLMARISGDAK